MLIGRISKCRIYIIIIYINAFSKCLLNLKKHISLFYMRQNEMRPAYLCQLNINIITLPLNNILEKIYQI